MSKLIIFNENSKLEYDILCSDTNNIIVEDYANNLLRYDKKDNCIYLWHENEWISYITNVNCYKRED